MQNARNWWKIVKQPSFRVWVSGVLLRQVIVSMFAISTFRDWWRQIMRSRDRPVGFHHCPAILQITRSSGWLLSCRVQSDCPYTIRCTLCLQNCIKIEVSCFLCCLRLLSIFIAGSPWVLGTKWAFCNEIEFRCSWQLYRPQLIMNAPISENSSEASCALPVYTHDPFCVAWACRRHFEELRLQFGRWTLDVLGETCFSVCSVEEFACTKLHGSDVTEGCAGTSV